MTKRVLLFVTNRTRTFGHLSYADLDRYWNKRRNLCPHANTGESSQIYAQGILQVPEQLKIGTVEGCWW